MSNVLTATDLRTLTLKDARAQTTLQERALLRGPERNRFASWLDRLEAETRERINLLEAEHTLELERRNGRMTEDQKRTLDYEHTSQVDALRRDLKAIYARIDELTAPPEPPIVQLRKAITEPVEVKPEPSPVEQDITGWLTTKEAASIYGIGLSTVNLYVKQGKLTGIKVHGGSGPEWRIKPPETKVQSVVTPEPSPITSTSVPVQQDTTGWLTVKEAAVAYGLATSTMKTHARLGKVEAVLIDVPTGKAYRIKPPTTPVKQEVTTTVPEPRFRLVDTRNWLTVREGQAAYNLSNYQMLYALRQGKIEGVKISGPIGQEWRIKPPATEQQPSSIEFNTSAGNIVATLPPATQYEQDLIAKINQEEQNFAAAMMEADNLGNKLVESLSKPLVTVPVTTLRIAIDFSPALWTIVILLAIIAAVLIIGQVQYYLP